MHSVENDSQRTLQVYPFINCFKPDEAVTSLQPVCLLKNPFIALLTYVYTLLAYNGHVKLWGG